ncbi:hypothetical protein SALBM135S_07098 [Streptomyces alboniger]
MTGTLAGVNAEEPGALGHSAPGPSDRWDVRCYAFHCSHGMFQPL